jgi:hypothetical protein
VRDARKGKIPTVLMDALWLDLRWSVRTLAKRPLASLAVVAILASAIAVATVLGGFFAAIVFDLPPIDSPEAIARVWRADATRPVGYREGSASDFLAWKDAARTLTALTAWSQRQVIVGEADGRTAAALLISSEYFHLTGQTPRIGRPFLPLDFEQHDVAIISDRLWRERFNGDPMIVGRRLAVDVKPLEIVGVMPPGFWFPSRAVDVWLPLSLTANADLIDMAGRLTRGATLAEAQSEFDVLVQRGVGPAGRGRADRTLLRSVPAEAKVRMGLGLQVLVAPAFAILLIACANVGNLLIIRTITREHELAVRAALGATAARLARLSLVETAVLGVCAGVLGAALCDVGNDAPATRGRKRACTGRRGGHQAGHRRDRRDGNGADACRHRPAPGALSRATGRLAFARGARTDFQPLAIQHHRSPGRPASGSRHRARPGQRATGASHCRIRPAEPTRD